MSISYAILLSLLLAINWSANARKDSGDYWKGVMKDEPMPVALEALILPNNPSKETSQHLPKKPDCHPDAPLTTFEPRSSATAYVTSRRDHEKALADEKPSFKSSFEPRPTISSYHDGDSTHVVAVGQKQRMEDDMPLPVAEIFEPRPNISAYGD